MKHTKGIWKAKKIPVNDECIVYTIWIHDTSSLDYSKHKKAVCIIPPTYFPPKNDNLQYVKDQKELEANILLMASAPDLMKALQDIELFGGEQAKIASKALNNLIEGRFKWAS